MCGIAGIYNPSPAYPVNRDILQRMTAVLEHRGPDDDGFYVNEGIGLGQRRLSIIDIANGKQPICNEDRTKWVVFNGEIFNYIELMDMLIKKGHQFSTRCDTEVIVHLYEEYGENFVNHLNGQFAIAIWDDQERKLVLVRDRVGIRPLYYAHVDESTLLFASEMKSLFCHPRLYAQFDPIGFEQVFTMWVTIPPQTVFKGVCELAPGSMIIAQNHKIVTKKYWHLTFPDKGSYDDKPITWYSERLRELLYDAVTIRLRADVPVAAYLSGGLDSSIITAMVKKYHNNDLMTFSVTFNDKLYDESKYQNSMVSFLGTHHRTVNVDYADIGEIFSDVVWHAESPMIRTAPAPLFALSGLVRRNNIKVVLTGEGADEVFGGYNIFKENRLRRFWAKNPDSRLRPLLLQRLYPYIKNDANTGTFWQYFFKKGLLSIDNPYYSHMIRWSNTSRLKMYFTENFRSNFNEREHITAELERYLDPDISRWDPLCQAQYIETMLFMSGYLLSSQGDRMMMGHSVEGRFPFLDYRVVEFGATVPPQYKINILNEKYLLKKTFADLVPAEVVERAKQPYRAPIAQCFIQNKNIASQVISQTSLEKANVFEPSTVRTLIDKMNIQSDTHIGAVDDMAIASIVSTQLLYHHFVDDLIQTDPAEPLQNASPTGSGASQEAVT